MMIWLAIAALSVATAAALLLGVRMFSPGQAGDGAMLAVYRQQLVEIDADLARGLIGADEAKAHHAEVARRLLAAAQGARSRHSRPVGKASGRTVFIAAVLVPALALVFYAKVGAPAMPGVPQAERLAVAERENDLEAMVYKVEKHLAAKPEDAAGWEILIPSYQAVGRYSDAAEAYRHLITIKGATADLQANLAEMLMFAGNGLMPKAGAEAARAALALDPTHQKARYYDALALSQDGKKQEALAKFRALLAAAPADAPWRSAVANEILAITSASATAPLLTDEQVREADGMSPENRQAMIEAMVDRLATRLETNPNDLQGWLRLMRAYVMLNQGASAVRARDTARTVFAGDKTAATEIEMMSQQLNMP